MKCHNCGQELQDGSRFCNSCGIRLDHNPTPIQNGYYISEETKANNRAESFGVVSLVFGIISIISVGLLIVPEIIGIVCGAVSKKSDGSRTKQGTAGMICGIIGMILGIFFYTLIIYLIVAFSKDALPDFVPDSASEQVVQEQINDNSIGSQIIISELPVEITCYWSDDEIEAIYEINEVSYEIEYGSMTLTVAGEKTFCNDDFSSGIICYKLYDSENYVVETGQIMPDPYLSEGDKFKEEALILADIDSDETYRLEFSDFKY